MFCTATVFLPRALLDTLVLPSVMLTNWLLVPLIVISPILLAAFWYAIAVSVQLEP